jgi:DNA-directed RNA polymerase subunit RPC12/RpoP
VSVLRPASCPRCGSREFAELARWEAGDLTLPGETRPFPEQDTAAYSCDRCGLEFTSPEPALR